MLDTIIGSYWLLHINKLILFLEL